MTNAIVTFGFLACLPSIFCFQKHNFSNSGFFWALGNIVESFETRSEIRWLHRFFSLQLFLPILLRLEVYCYAPNFFYRSHPIVL